MSPQSRTAAAINAVSAAKNTQHHSTHLQKCLQHAAAAGVLGHMLQLAGWQRRHRIRPLLAGGGGQAQQRAGHGAAQG